MNELNYASLEASKRLVDAGIVLKTEMVWAELPPENWQLQSRLDYHLVFQYCPSVPAPSMVEVWRELPENTVMIKVFKKHFAYIKTTAFPNLPNTNPTDALIDLLIWVRKESKDA
jgi:hypothetical protein